MKKLLPEQIVQAREWRGQGVAWAEIGRRFNVKYDTVQRAIDPKFQAYERDRAAAMRFRHRVESSTHVRERRDTFRPTEEEFQAARALIPFDTRTAAQRFLDEPLPGRSALDKLRAAGRAI